MGVSTKLQEIAFKTSCAEVRGPGNPVGCEDEPVPTQCTDNGPSFTLPRGVAKRDISLLLPLMARQL
jgi:hypothetical protein